MLLEIDTTSATPIYTQIRDQMILGIAQGDLKVSESLPSVRQLADELGVNMMTISKAYTVLKKEGYLLTDRRKGTQVAPYPKKTDSFAREYQQQLALLTAEAAIHGLTPEEMVKDVVNLFTEFRKDESV